MAIATNIPLLLMTGFVIQGHMLGLHCKILHNFTGLKIFMTYIQNRNLTVHEMLLYISQKGIKK